MERRADSSGRRAWLWSVIPAVLALVFVGVEVARPMGGHGPGTHIGLKHARHDQVGPQKPRTGGRGAARAPRPLGVPGSWKLILDSDFAAGRLDASVWRVGWFGSGVTGPINRHESACYVPGNATVSRHTGLVLRVARAESRCAGDSHPYTGAVLSTNPHDGRLSGGFTYRYGVLEAKIFLPAATHTRVANWPAVLGLGRTWPKDGEDDVIENLGGLVCSHFHSPGHAPGGNLGGCVTGFTPGWHVVSSNWEPGSVSWYYDGIEIAHADKGITSSPQYLVLVNTVSAKSPGVARPDAMRVAYVRVWQRRRPAGRSR